MHFVFLAAGKGTRIFSKIKTNKCLIKISNKTIIERLLENIPKDKRNKIFIATGFNRKEILNETNEKLRLNLDDLYEQKQKYDTNTLIIYNNSDNRRCLRDHLAIRAPADRSPSPAAKRGPLSPRGVLTAARTRSCAQEGSLAAAASPLPDANTGTPEATGGAGAGRFSNSSHLVRKGFGFCDFSRRFAGGTPQGRGLGCTGCLNGLGFERRRGLRGGTWGPGDGSQEKCMVFPLLIYTGAFRRAVAVLLCWLLLPHKRLPAGRVAARSMACASVCTLYCSLTIVCACWAARGSILMPNRGLSLC